MCYASTIEKIWLEEQMNLLLADPVLAKIRYRASHWVLNRLEDRIKGQLCNLCGLRPEQWGQFQTGQEPEFSRVQQAVFTNFKISRDEKRELRILAELCKDASAERMLAYLVKKEAESFRKQAEITDPAWRRFINCSSYTSPEVASRIENALQLTPDERSHFRALLFQDTFQATQALKEHVRKQIEGKKTTITAFLQKAEISENAWEPFRTNAKNLPTSQATLLKLIVGLEADQEKGAALLHEVNSDFVMRRDLAVLICIQNRIYNIREIYYVLEFFANGYSGERFYRNLYASPDGGVIF